MALKDSLKLFRNENGYDIVVGKKDIDDNFILLADGVDKNPFTISDGNIKPISEGVRLIFGSLYNPSSASDALFVGRGASLRQSSALCVGNATGDGTLFAKRVFCNEALVTADDTPTYADESIALDYGALHHLKIVGMAMRDDQSAKWVFERGVTLLVDDHGDTVSIVSDAANDIVKEVDAWAFDIETQNAADGNPALKIKCTGEADKVVLWGYSVEMSVLYRG